MATHGLSFLENDCAYEHSRYERPARYLFGQSIDSQADTIVLEGKSQTQGNPNIDGVQKMI